MSRRCTVSAGPRRCCRPAHGVAVKHLLASPPLTFEAAMKIAAAWGYPPGAASASVRGSMSAGPIVDVDKFITVLEMFGDALVEASDRKRRASP